MIRDKQQLIKNFMQYMMSRKNANYIPYSNYQVYQEGGVNITFDVAILDANDNIIEFYEIKTNGLTSEDVRQGNLKYQENIKFLSQLKRIGAKNALGYLVTFDEKKSDFDVYLITNKISKLSQFVDAIMQVSKLSKSRTNFYRGQGDINYSLLPGLYRKESTPSKEKSLYKEAIRRCPGDFSGLTSTFQHLVKLQHYGMPTRLLDLTSNALIALYFAVESMELQDKDAVVYVFSVKKDEIKSYDSDTVSVVANLARVDTFMMNDQSSIDDFNKQDDTLYLLHEIRYEKPQFLPLINPKDLHATLCVKPKLDNARIRQQSGAFFLYGIGDTKDTCSKLKEHPINIIIDHNYKKKLKEELSYLGITDAYVYPEMDHVMNDIKAELGV